MELRDVLSEVPDLRIVWVMADSQINARSRAFIDDYGLRDRVLFLADEDSRMIRELGILRPNAEPIEQGVPHPTTYLLDRDGVVRFVDVRQDFHVWLDPRTLAAELARIP